jgi:hypothetical protein
VREVPGSNPGFPLFCIFLSSWNNYHIHCDNLRCTEDEYLGENNTFLRWYGKKISSYFETSLRCGLKKVLIKKFGAQFPPTLDTTVRNERTNERTNTSPHSSSNSGRVNQICPFYEFSFTLEVSCWGIGLGV